MSLPSPRRHSPQHFPAPQQGPEEPISPQGSKEVFVGVQGSGLVAVSQVQFLDELPAQPSRKQFRASKQLSNHSSNAANIFRVKFGNNSEKKDKLTYVRYENYTSARTRKTTEQKIFEINNFVKKLTENMNKEDEVPEITDTKFRALKKIIEYYDIKNLDRSEYANVIKSFGLQIGSVRAEQKNYSFSEGKPDQKRFRPVNALLHRTHQKLTTHDIFNLERDILPSSLQRVSISEQKGKSVPQNPEGVEGVTEKQEGGRLFNSLQMRKSKLREKSIKKQFKFSSADNCIRQKINKYREFLFALNFSNRLYRNMQLEKYEQPLKFYVGRGNNSNLIRSLMKKRFWFEETTNQKQANFVWTQIKLPTLFNRQSSVLQQSCGQKTDRKPLPKGACLPKNDPLSKILYSQECREMAVLIQIMRNKNIEGFDERIKLCNRSLKKEQVSGVIHNHVPGNGLLGNKKAMFLCLKEYCGLVGQQVFNFVPLTFIIAHGLMDPQYARMTAYYNERKQARKSNYWILKPGQFSNRGNGIECTNKLEDIRKRVGRRAQQKKGGSLIVQEYMVKPLLYNGRKFDIRAYMLLTCHNGKTKAYWYQQGYVRTSSHFFSLDELDPYVHLTNDAVQQHSDTYGRFQQGNKLSYPELQRYLDTLPANGRTLDLHQIILPQMKAIAGQAVKSAWLGLNREGKDRNFELFGLDFMIDQSFKPWLIEINTNPCLEMSSPVLERIIPYMVENLLRIAVDTVFPPPDNFGNNYKYNIPQNSLHYNKFELVFDSDRDARQLQQLYSGRDPFAALEGLQEDKTEYKQEGQMLNLDDL